MGLIAAAPAVGRQIDDGLELAVCRVMSTLTGEVCKLPPGSSGETVISGLPVTGETTPIPTATPTATATPDPDDTVVLGPGSDRPPDDDVASTLPICTTSLSWGNQSIEGRVTAVVGVDNAVWTLEKRADGSVYATVAGFQGPGLSGAPGAKVAGRALGKLLEMGGKRGDRAGTGLESPSFSEVAGGALGSADPSVYKLDGKSRTLKFSGKRPRRTSPTRARRSARPGSSAKVRRRGRACRRLPAPPSSSSRARRTSRRGCRPACPPPARGW